VTKVPKRSVPKSRHVAKYRHEKSQARAMANAKASGLEVNYRGRGCYWRFASALSGSLPAINASDSELLHQVVVEQRSSTFSFRLQSNI
jgi:hypothetical protein